MRNISASIKKVITFTLIITCTLIVSEVIYRAWTGSPLIPDRNFVSYELEENFYSMNFYEFDQTLGWKFQMSSINKKPVVSLQKDGLPSFTIGEFSLRMNNSSEFRKPMKRAILAAGDSFTAGAQVKDDESWPAILEIILSTPVLNSGVSGYGVDQIVLRVEALAKTLSPKVVIYSFLDEDILRTSYDIFSAFKPYYILTEDGGLALHEVPVKETVSRTNRLGLLRTIFGYSKIIHEGMKSISPYTCMGRELSFRQVSTNKEAIEISCRLLDKIIADSKRFNFRPLIVMQYGGDRILHNKRSWYALDLLKCIRERQLPLLDTFEKLNNFSQKDIEGFTKLYIQPKQSGAERFGHMSKAGNTFIANQIAHFFDFKNNDVVPNQ